MKRSFSRSIFHSCIAIFVGASSASIAAPVCKDGVSVTIAGEITIDAAPTDSGGDWMLVAPTLDSSNKCTVMDLFGKGPIPTGCTQDKHFKATGTVRDQGYALNVKDVTCF